MSSEMLTLERFEEASEKVKEVTLPTDRQQGLFKAGKYAVYRCL